MMQLSLINLIILLKLDYYDRTMIREFKYFIKVTLLLANLNIVLKLNYYDKTIMIKLLLGNLNVLLSSNYYGGTIVDKFKYFIKIKLL
jgi:ethanolamine transporter EutH